MYVRQSLLAGAALLFAASASAQTMRAPQRHTSFGLIAGANFAKLGGENISGAGTRTGFSGGVYGDWPLGGGLSIRPQLLYSMEGAKANDVDGAGTDATIRLDYIRLPLLVRYAFSTTGQLRPFFALGPSFGIQAKCEFGASSGGASASVSCDDAGDALGGGLAKKTFEFSGRVEAGVDFPVGTKALTIGGAYSHGFTSALDVVGASPKNRVWTLFVALRL